MADPATPTVPIAAGVPNVNRGATPNGVTQLTSDSTGIAAKQKTVWAIYDKSGAVALKPDAFLSLEFRREYQIPTYPIEGGGFESYNKVQTPFASHVGMVISGTKDQRKAFFSALDAIVASYDLYSILTPEQTYKNVNATSYTYDRDSHNGFQSVVIDLSFEEVRLAPAASFTHSKNPSGAAAQHGGAIQTTPAPSPPSAPK